MEEHLVMRQAGWSPNTLEKLGFIDCISPIKGPDCESLFDDVKKENQIYQNNNVNPQKVDGRKRINCLRTPVKESQPQTKLVDIKSTPTTRHVIKNTSIVDDMNSGGETLEKEVCDLTSSFSQQTISPQVKFQPATMLFKNQLSTQFAGRRYSLHELEDELPLGWKLFPHQKEAIELCYNKERCILALEMGLGKTLISLLWAKMVSYQVQCLTIVIAPCTLLENWQREAKMVGFQISNLSKSIVPSARLNLLPVSWAKIPNVEDIFRCWSVRNYIVICDEAHAMQSLLSQRTSAALRLLSHAHCRGTVLATGTPMKNGRPSNLFPLLVGIRHPIAKNKLEYERRFCNARKTKYCPWDISGASNLEELKQVVMDRIIRMRKNQCLALPPLIREIVEITVSAQDQKHYDGIIAQLRRAKLSKCRDSPNQLEIMGQLRKFCSIVKTKSVIEFIKSRRPPIVVFVWYIESAHIIVDSICGSTSLTAIALTGEIDKKERQILIDEFQNGKFDIFVCTFGVGATGITLTKSSTILFVDRPWTPGDLLQAEDRIHRIGQMAVEVYSIWISAFPIDQSLDNLLRKKQKNSTKVIEVNYSRTGESRSDTELGASTSKKCSDIRNYFETNASHHINYIAQDSLFAEAEGEDEDESNIISKVIRDIIQK